MVIPIVTGAVVVDAATILDNPMNSKVQTIDVADVPSGSYSLEAGSYLWEMEGGAHVTLTDSVYPTAILVDANIASYSTEQLEAVKAMVNTYSTYMEGWATANIAAWQTPETTVPEETVTEA